MKNEEYISRIVEMTNKITDNAILRRIYLFLVVVTGAGH